MHAREHRMAQRVACPINAGRLAVPVTADAVVPAIGSFRGELAPHDSGRGELLVQRCNVYVREPLASARRSIGFTIESGQRRSGVSRHERRSVQPLQLVDSHLFEGQPSKSLDPGDKDPTRIAFVAVVELIAGER